MKESQQETPALVPLPPEMEPAAKRRLWLGWEPEKLKMVAEWLEPPPAAGNGKTQMEKPPGIVKEVIKLETLQEMLDGVQESAPEEWQKRVVWPAPARVLTWVKGRERCLREPNTKM